VKRKPSPPAEPSRPVRELAALALVECGLDEGWIERLFGNSHEEAVSRARHVAVEAARRRYDFSDMDLARLFGRDRGVARLAQRRASEEERVEAAVVAVVDASLLATRTGSDNFEHRCEVYDLGRTDGGSVRRATEATGSVQPDGDDEAGARRMFDASGYGGLGGWRDEELERYHDTGGLSWDEASSATRNVFVRAWRFAAAELGNEARAELSATLRRIHAAINDRAPHDNLEGCIVEWIEVAKERITEGDLTVLKKDPK